MSIILKDALEMEYLDEFQLIAGMGGLEGYVHNVGILDYEIIEDTMDVFVKGELVLATFSVARDNEALVFQSIKSLIKQEVAALAIKTVFYKTLPDYILNYANKHDFPIFIYHPSIYSENIIRTVFNGIKSKGLHAQLEIKLETLFKGELNSSVVQDIAYELNPEFYENYYIAYCQEKRFLSEDNSIRLVDKFLRVANRNNHYSVMKFRKGFVVFLTSKEPNQIKLPLDIEHIFESLGLKVSEFTIGVSHEHDTLHTLDICLKESYYSFQSAVDRDISLIHYKEAGINQLLLSIVDQPWSVNYAKTLLGPILKYDEKYNGNLYETTKLFFKCECQSNETAKLMFQHRNTILYRIRKVKELAGPFRSEHDFQVQVSIAIKIVELTTN